jgi:DeoR/GlpR family transcriptional regulator of sugar metabolism
MLSFLLQQAARLTKNKNSNYRTATEPANPRIEESYADRAASAVLPRDSKDDRPVSRGSRSRLLGEARRARILDWLQEEGSARVRTLAEAFDVSEVTMRQDLEKLEVDGHIVREHGGAFLKSVTQQVRSMALQHLDNMDAKRRIGRAAAALANDGETVILDSGSTTTEVAAQLTGKRDMTVITNALNIALMLGAEPGFEVHMTGGHFKAPTLSLSGERSADYFRGLFVQKLFLATAAIDLEAGLTYPAMSDIAVKRAMIAAAQTVILVADSSKIGQRSFTSLGGLELVRTLVIDEAIRDEDRAAIEAIGVEVIVA